jgi:phosphoenolpyruvate-protein phosphotransferase
VSHSIKGFPAAPGIAIGFAFWAQPVKIEFSQRPVDTPEAEFKRLEESRDHVQQSMQVILERSAENLGSEERAIFDAHRLMLNDPDLWSLVKVKIFTGNLSAESAWDEAIFFYANQLKSINDPYLQARALDIQDIGSQVLRRLLGMPDVSLESLPGPVVVLAQDLFPSDTIRLDRSKLLGFCTCDGGTLSHTAILARALGLPAVIGIGPKLKDLQNGIQLIMNGTTGEVIYDPDDATLKEFRLLREKQQRTYTEAKQNAHLPAATLDGRRVKVVANIGSTQDAQLALEMGAEGVGLLRTEFLYMDRTSAPDEYTQREAYQAILDVMETRPVVIRTLDIGGDKSPSYMDLGKEMNPFLGWRAIRVCLEQPDFFKTQLRALLQAGTGHDVRIMFPMIATLDEFRRAKELLVEARRELAANGLPQADMVEVGTMVEIPSTVILADAFAREVDFFSIGTNDLTQYTFAADRTNTKVSSLVNAFHPAIFRQIDRVIEAAHAMGIWVGVCGELAGDPEAIPILIGLGVDELSMAPTAIPIAKQEIRTWSTQACQRIAKLALDFGNSGEIRQLARTTSRAT